MGRRRKSWPLTALIPFIPFHTPAPPQPPRRGSVLARVDRLAVVAAGEQAERRSADGRLQPAHAAVAEDELADVGVVAAEERAGVGHRAGQAGAGAGLAV